jgi:hypothetical protein
MFIALYFQTFLHLYNKQQHNALLIAWPEQNRIALAGMGARVVLPMKKIAAFSLARH